MNRTTIYLTLAILFGCLAAACQGQTFEDRRIFTDKRETPAEIVPVGPKEIRKHGLIEIWSGPNCPHCESLKAVLPEIQAAGWKVVIYDNTPPGPIPRGTAWIRNRPLNFTGFRGRAAMFSLLRDANRFAEPERQLATPAKQVVMGVDRYPRKWHNTDGRTLYEHLLHHPNHQIDTSTWTEDQREIYHDAWHDEHGP